MNSNTYSTLVADSRSGYAIYGARSGGGLDQVKWSAGWTTTSLNGNTYTALASDSQDDNYVYGARSGGGLDSIDLNGSSGLWVTNSLNSNTYVALAADSQDGNYVYGARAGGGLDTIEWASGWGDQLAEQQCVRRFDRRQPEVLMKSMAHDPAAGWIRSNGLLPMDGAPIR